MKAIAKNIIIKEPVEEKKSSGGIILQEKSTKNVPIEVEVVNVGAEASYVKEGDHILISPYSGSKFTIGDDSYRVLSENDVLIII